MRRFIAGSIFALALAAAPAHAGTYAVAEGSKLTYYVSHPMHEVVGVSDKARGEFAYDPAKPDDFSGLAKKAIQVEWASFGSGNANRDANARSVVGAAQYPTVTVLVESVTDVKVTGTTVEATLNGRLYMNGVKKPVSAPIKLDLADPAALKAAAKFTVKMTDFNMEPPSLMFVSTKDEVVIEAALILKPK